MKSTERESIEKRLSNRIGDDVERAASLLKGEYALSMGPDDLNLLHTSWDLTRDPPGLTGPVGWVRRMLPRLLFPTFKYHSRYTESNSRVVLEIVDRLEVLQHAVRDLQPPGRTEDKLSNVVLDKRPRR